MHHLKIDLTGYKNDPNLSLFYYKFSPCFLDKNDSTCSFRRAFYKEKTPFLTKFSLMKPCKKIIEKRIEAMARLTPMENRIKLKNITRFICGTGYTSTLEWGLNFDWTSGVPFLPGSSFKGALISYLEFLQGKPSEKWNSQDVVEIESGDSWTKCDVYKLFGAQGETDEPDSGKIIFFNVYPEDFSGFDVDVITPHHKNYYQNNQPPADTENPTPIPFLTIKPNSKFLFIFKVKENEGVSVEQTTKLRRLIIETGENFGFGAKTSTGYGYFQRCVEN